MISAAARATLTELADRIGHEFTDLSLLEQALRHRSWCAENDGVASNERLEFLGDAVLGWAIADLAYRRFPETSEGGLTELRKSVVSEPALAEIAIGIGLGDFMKLGNSELMSGGVDKPSLLSDTFEAVLAAVYLDGGPQPAIAFVERLVAPHLDASVGQVAQRDHKSELQYLCDRRGLPHPDYELTKEGPSHAPVFTADATIDGRSVASGEGRSKKSAEQAAAAAALAALS